MIQKHLNIITAGARGGFGKQVVFRIRYGQVILSAYPGKRAGKRSAAEKLGNIKFTTAASWSEKVRKSEELKAFYTERLSGALNVHNLAISDSLCSPEIKSVSVKDGVFTIHATDNVWVAAVTVQVYDVLGALLEEGNADRMKQGDKWTYPVAMKNIADCITIIAASDLPGNKTFLTLQA